MSIEVRQLRKVFGAQTAVNNISFSVPRGQVTGFLGPNGAGKSTSMKMLTGYLKPDGGTATICGIQVTENALAARRKIGYLPESNALYHDMYVREYLAFVGSLYRLPNTSQAVRDVIEKVGLGTEAHKKIGQLSKGYKQRTGLAAAIIHDPEVLILDEPTSGLDPNQIVEIRQVIRQLGAQKTVLLSTHIMQEVEAICEQVIILHRGNIVANDSLANLHKASHRQTLRVGFEESLEAEWLQRLPAAETVEKTDALHWELQTTEPDALRRQVLAMAAENGLNVTSLQTGGGSLEEIFRGLTT